MGSASAAARAGGLQAARTGWGRQRARPERDEGAAAAAPQVRAATASPPGWSAAGAPNRRGISNLIDVGDVVAVAVAAAVVVAERRRLRRA